MAELNINDYDRDPVQAIQEYFMNAADEDYEITAEMVAETVVDQHCARGDFEGCSSELEQDHQDAVAWAKQAGLTSQWGA